MKKKSNEKLEEIFPIISDPTRRKILDLCNNSNCSIDDLAKNIKKNTLISKRLVESLENFDLIECNKSTYHTTPIGYGLVETIKSIEFLNNNREFFSNHNFGDIDHNLIRQIGSLYNSKFYNGVHVALSKWSKIILEANEKIDMIFLNPPIVIADYLKKRIDDGVVLRLVIGENSIITDCNEFVNKLELRIPRYQNSFEKRRAKIVQTNLLKSEKEACLMFPNKNGVTDINGNFFSDDPNCLVWSDDFFSSKWKDAQPISRIK